MLNEPQVRGRSGRRSDHDAGRQSQPEPSDDGESLRELIARQELAQRQFAEATANMNAERILMIFRIEAIRNAIRQAQRQLTSARADLDLA
jgi:hypothetical protein